MTRIFPFQVAGKRQPVTISVGLAPSTEFGNCSVDEIMHEADMALYAAKAAGRNCVRLAQPKEVSTKELPILAPPF